MEMTHIRLQQEFVWQDKRNAYIYLYISTYIQTEVKHYLFKRFSYATENIETKSNETQMKKGKLVGVKHLIESVHHITSYISSSLYIQS